MKNQHLPPAAFEKSKGPLRRCRNAFSCACSCLAIWVLPYTATPFVIAVQQGLNCNYCNITTDSFNSANPNQSINGLYDASRAGTNGDIACLAGLAQLEVANIKGALFLGPNARYGLTNSGAISGRVDTDLQYVFPEVNLPSAAWLPAAPLLSGMVIDGVSYSYVFPDVSSNSGGTGYYSISGLNSTVYVGSNQNIALLLTGNAATPVIRVARNARLAIYMDGPSLFVNGRTMVDSGNAADLNYYGTTNNTQITLQGNASFTGTIYAPQADFRLVTGGSNAYDFVGTSVIGTLSFAGNFHFHFDENLERLGLCPPQIVAQPQDQSVVSGQDAGFNISANAAFSYQWLFNGTNIPGATASSLAISHATTSNGGRYWVTIASPWGIQTSSQALLTVLDPPVIDRQPANTTAVLGGGANFSVLAHGLEPLCYQWRTNGTDLPGATNATLSLSALQPADFATYCVLVTNAVGSTLSDTALLSPAVPPSIRPVSLNSGTLTIAFPTELGPTYIIEYKFDLEDAFWQELKRIAGTGQAGTITDNGLTTTRKFYRVRLQ